MVDFIEAIKRKVEGYKVTKGAKELCYEKDGGLFWTWSKLGTHGLKIEDYLSREWCVSLHKENRKDNYLCNSCANKNENRCEELCSDKNG
jgi:hypothetical protein